MEPIIYLYNHKMANFLLNHESFWITLSESRVCNSTTHCSLNWCIGHVFFANSFKGKKVSIKCLSDLVYMPQKWLLIYTYRSCTHPMNCPPPFFRQKFNEMLVFATITRTGLAWCSTCSTKSATTVSIWFETFGNITISYTTIKNTLKTCSSSSHLAKNFFKNFHRRHSLFPFMLCTWPMVVLSNPIICDIFFGQTLLLSSFSKRPCWD